MTETAAAPTPSPMTLSIVRTTADSPVSSTHDVSVSDPAAAHAHLAYYRDDRDRIAAYLFTAAGAYAGTGIAGRGMVRSDWEPRETATDEPDELFERVGEDEYRCRRCGADDSHLECDSWPSFGGTTEGFERCTRCGASVGFADLSAVR